MIKRNSGRIANPYKVLGVPHDANSTEIKLAYRKLALKYHPDRQSGKTDGERKIASDRFAEIGTAYSILGDPNKKRQFDHIYKYGGFDETDSQIDSQQNKQNEDPFSEQIGGSGKKIGFKASIYIPGFGEACAPTLTKRTTYSSVEIPNRHNIAAMRSRQGSAGFVFASGKTEILPGGLRTQVSKKSQIINGKRYTRTETTVTHPDGMKEVTIQDNDSIQKSVQPAPLSKPNEEPQSSHQSSKNTKEQHSGVLNGVWKKIISCNTPCGPILVT